MSKLMGLIISSFFCVSCVTTGDIKSPDEAEKNLVRKWVLSRCIGHATNDALTRQDAFNSASAYLELSTMPVERFASYEGSIKEALAKSPSGSIEGSFNVKTCIDHAQALDL